MTLERDNFSTHQTIYRRLATGADTVMPDFATGPLTMTDSRYQAPEMPQQWVTHIRLYRSHRMSAPIHIRAHNNTKLKSP